MSKVEFWFGRRRSPQKSWYVKAKKNMFGSGVYPLTSFSVTRCYEYVETSKSALV